MGRLKWYLIIGLNFAFCKTPVLPQSNNYYVIPEHGCLVIRFPFENKYPNVTWRRVIRKGQHPKSYASGLISGNNRSGGTKVYPPKEDISFVGFEFDFSSPKKIYKVFVNGWVFVSGDCRIDIIKGKGYGTAYSWAKSILLYGSEKLKAEGKTGLAVTTVGTSMQIGGGLTIRGFGGSINVTWRRDAPKAQESNFMDFDIGVEQEAYHASVGLGSAGSASLTLENGAKGFSSFNAYSACLIHVKLRHIEAKGAVK